MAKDGPNEKTKELLVDSFEEITELLKVLSQPNRFKILILLLEGPNNFQTLLTKTKLKKSALANHLTILVDASLVKKVQHGMYKITVDGKNFINSIGETYLKSLVHKKNTEDAEQRYKISRAFIDRKK